MIYNTIYHALGFAACYQRDARIIHELLRAALYEPLGSAACYHRDARIT